MHQSIPAAPSPTPPGYCGAFARLVSLGGGEFANFALPGGWAFANPKLLTRTRFPIRIQLHKWFYWTKLGDWLICQGRETIEEVCKGMFSILCVHFFIAYQARITGRWSYRRESTVIESNFCWVLFQEHPFIFLKLFITVNFTAHYRPCHGFRRHLDE